MSEKPKPRVIVLAGCNGAGKSTSSAAILDPKYLRNYINPDLIARGIAPDDPSLAAIAAGRFTLSLIRQFSQARENFAFETTLSGFTYAKLLKDLTANGYESQLFFFYLSSPELAVFRVSERVREGGHHIPEDVVRRRYDAGLRNFFRLYSGLVSSWRFIDNTRKGKPLEVASSLNQELKISLPELWGKLRDTYDNER